MLKNNKTKPKEIFMKKIISKIISIGLAVVMLCGIIVFSGCDGCNSSTLQEYKATAVTALERYAEGKGQSNYTHENWLVLQSHVTTGRDNINAAETKPAVRTARDNAKAAVRAVEREGANMNEIEFTEGVFSGYFDETNFDGTDRISAIIRSHGELVSFFEEYEVIWFSSTPIWKNYGYEFFEDHALMLFFLQTSGVLGSQISYAVDSLQLANSTLTLYIQSNTYSEVISNVTTIVPFVIEVSNNNIQNIIDFSAFFIAGQQP